MNTASSAVSTATWNSRPAQRATLASSRRYGQIRSSFRPHPLLRGAHLQTIASYLRPAPKLVLRRERLELPDGDFVDLGWSGDHNKTGPLAVLVHGLCGGFESKYARGTACQLIARGWRTVIFQLRGAGPEPNRLQRCYDQGDTEDLRYFWHLLREREPHAFIATVGWSLGGNVTLKALAEEGKAAPVDIAAAASVPFSIRPCAERLRTGFSRFYQKRLLDALKDALRRKHAHVAPSPLVNLAAALVARDFIEYDEAYTAPLAGYRDAADYYTHSSCGPLLRHIRCPTLVVHALDDPFMTADIVPELKALSPCVTLEVAQSGGHVGFVSAGALGLPYCWLERRLSAYLHDGYERHIGAHGHPTSEADVEHAGAKDLIKQLLDMKPGDDHYDAKVTVLGENIDHHVKEEQDEMFPKAKKAKLDLTALGAKMLERKKELLERSGNSVAQRNARAA